MPQYSKYSECGRTLMVKFTCRRCKKTEFLELEKVADDQDYGHLHNTKTPKDWSELYGGLLCDKCYEDFKKFLSGADMREVEQCTE